MCEDNQHSLFLHRHLGCVMVVQEDIKKLVLKLYPKRTIIQKVIITEGLSKPSMSA